jgi:hypothetical protein
MQYDLKCRSKQQLALAAIRQPSRATADMGLAASAGEAMQIHCVGELSPAAAAAKLVCMLLVRRAGKQARARANSSWHWQQ